MNKPGTAKYALAIILILAGILLPSASIVEAVRQNPPDESLRHSLLLGATLFRAGLVFLGAFVLLLSSQFSKQAALANKNEPGPVPQQSRLILGLILLVATGLRLYGLNSGLWHDEILSIVQYVRMPFGEIISTCKDANQHFLYTLMAHASFDLFGETNWALRLPAVLFGVGSIWALYYFGRVCTNERESLLTCALLTVSYYHIWFSQNARGYSGLLFFTILSSLFYIRAIESSPRNWLYYAISVALGMYTNMTLMFVIMAHVILILILLAFQRPKIWPQKGAILAGFLLGALLVFQLFALVLPQVVSGVGGEESTVPAWINPMWTFFEFVKAMEISFAGALVAMTALLVFAFGFISYARNRPMLIGLFLIPIVICGSLVIGLRHHLWPRFFYFAFGFGALIGIRGVMVVTENAIRILKIRFRNPNAVATAFCILLIAISATSLRYVYSPKQDFVGALKFVEANRRPNDAVITIGLASIDYEGFFKTNWKDVETLQDLESIRSRSNRTWVLYTFPTHVDAVYPDIMRTIRKDFVVVKEFYGTVGAGTIFVCRSNSVTRSSS